MVPDWTQILLPPSSSAEGDVGRAVHHEALAVIIVGADEGQPEIGLARHGPGRVAREEVDLARLERVEAVGGRQRHVLDLVGVAEDGGGDRTAEVDVEARPLAGGVGDAEAEKALVDAADEMPALLDVVERSRESGRGRNGDGEERGQRADRHGIISHLRFPLPFSRSNQSWAACRTTTLVPTGTRLKRSMTSGLTSRKQPEETAWPIVCGWLVPWMR